MQYSREIGWRIFYIFISFILCFLTSLYFGEHLLRICLEPWCNEWEMDSRQYAHPREVWASYVQISFLLTRLLIYPLLGRHSIFFLANSLSYRECHKRGYLLLSSWCRLWFICYIRIPLHGVGFLLDVSHFDEDIERVYVPTLGVYMRNWRSLRVWTIIFSQLPLLWWYRFNRTECIKNFNLYPKERHTSMHEITLIRAWFMGSFVLPTLLSAVMLFDDIRLEILWVGFLRRLYLSWLYFYILHYVYVSNPLHEGSFGESSLLGLITGLFTYFLLSRQVKRLRKIFREFLHLIICISSRELKEFS